MNNFIGVGRLTRDPEVRHASNQTAVCRFSLAVDRPVKAGEKKQADFIPVVVFGRQAESCEKYLAKGSQCAVIGRIQTGSYTNKEGRKIYTTDVVASRVEFLGGGNGGRSQKQEEEPEPQFEALDENVPF